nr:MAG TPA: hypothetical protein [Caudoviricetes sp.]
MLRLYLHSNKIRGYPFPFKLMLIAPLGCTSESKIQS